MSRDITMPIAFDDIDVGERRELDSKTVKRLAESIDKIGLRHPITVIKRGERYRLVAGLHRMEACRKLGREHVMATIVSMTNADARLWEIAENLHRAELTKLERSNQTEEWRSLTQDEVRKVSAPIGGHQPDDMGFRKTAEHLGISEKEVRNAHKIASLSDEAKEAARDLDLDDNQSALLDAAEHDEPAAQVVALRTRAQPKDDERRSGEWRERFETVWRSCPSQKDREWALALMRNAA